MDSRYEALSFEPGKNSGVLRFQWHVQSNGSAPPGDLTLSYQVFDAATGALLIEGERSRVSTSVALPVRLPDEAGRYRVFCSPMTEHQSWEYERGLPFVLADIVLDRAGNARVSSLRITDLAAIRRSRALSLLPRVIALPFQTVWRNRRLSFTLTRREILSRSRGSFFGSLWTILNPLLLMATYFFVFGLVLQSRFEGDPRRSSFALYLLAGMLPWLAFSEAAGRAPFLLIEYRQLIRKVVFPIEMLPVNLVFTGLVGEAFALIVFALALVLFRHSLPWTILFLPLLLIPQMIFTLGVCWFLSALGAFLRDLTQVIGFLLTIWFFVTPICYPESQIPAGLRPVLVLNPMFVLVNGYRAILLRHAPPDWKALGIFSVVAIAVAVGAHAWFYKLKRSFADVL